MGNNDTLHLDKLKAYWAAHQAFPAMAKLRDVVGMNSTASVFEMIGRLVESGHLQRIEGRIAPTQAFFALTVVSLDPSNMPTPAAVNIASYVMPQPGKTFLVQVPDGRLERDNICQGDFLVMQQDLPALVNDLVVLAQGSEQQLAWVAGCDDKKFSLRPCYEVTASGRSGITVPGTAIAGVAVALVRRFDRNPRVKENCRERGTVTGAPD